MPELSELLLGLERVLGAADGPPIPLSGGITNRNYRLRFGGRDCVLRLPGQDTELLGIDRASERLAAERAASLGIGPELLHADGDCVVTAFVPGTAVDEERLRADPSQVARALRVFHDSGLQLPARFWIPDLLRVYAGTVTRRGGTLPDAFLRAQVLVDRIASVLPLTEPVPCHDDLLPGNLIEADGTILLVDWEYSGLGHRYFDLGNLAVNNDFDEQAEVRLLEAYFGEPGTDVPPTTRSSQLAALRLFRLVSDAREAAWGVMQGMISQLDFDFAAYADEHFERLERAAADPRHIEELLNAATP
ncbi:MAG TPA: phosphotransferase [Solirubrobacteraceae bacterium]|nr:phosphotransferase [Solirubrobacteraceae bacterium]